MSGLLPEEEAANVDQEAFKGGWVLATGEVSHILNAYQAERLSHNQSFQMPAVVKKTKEYADRFMQIKTDDSLQSVRRFLTEKGIKQYEYGMLVNLMPETTEEAYTLIPSLKDPSRFNDDQMQEILAQLAEYRSYT